MSQHRFENIIKALTYTNISPPVYRDKFHQIRDGSYPLHMAISSGAPIEVLQILVKAAPDVALKTDKFGQTCLDLVVKCGGTPEAVDLIRSYDPNCEAK